MNGSTMRGVKNVTCMPARQESWSRYVSVEAENVLRESL